MTHRCLCGCNIYHPISPISISYESCDLWASFGIPVRSLRLLVWPQEVAELTNGNIRENHSQNSRFVNLKKNPRTSVHSILSLSKNKIARDSQKTKFVFSSCSTKIDSRQGQASGMDGTLTLISTISETIRDRKKLIKASKHLQKL